MIPLKAVGPRAKTRSGTQHGFMWWRSYRIEQERRRICKLKKKRRIQGADSGNDAFVGASFAHVSHPHIGLEGYIYICIYISIRLTLATCLLRIVSSSGRLRVSMLLQGWTPYHNPHVPNLSSSRDYLLRCRYLPIRGYLNVYIISCSKRIVKLA